MSVGVVLLLDESPPKWCAESNRRVMLEAEGIILIPAGGSPLPAGKSYRNRRVDDRGTTIFVVSRFAEPLFFVRFRNGHDAGPSIFVVRGDSGLRRDQKS